MSESPRGYVSRAFDLCVGALLAAMALYGAVMIIKSIWVWLCVIAAVAVFIVSLWQILRTRFFRSALWNARIILPAAFVQFIVKESAAFVQRANH